LLLKLTIIISINHFVIIVNFRNHFYKAVTEIFIGSSPNPRFVSVKKLTRFMAKCLVNPLKTNKAWEVQLINLRVNPIILQQFTQIVVFFTVLGTGNAFFLNGQKWESRGKYFDVPLRSLSLLSIKKKLFFRTIWSFKTLLHHLFGHSFLKI